MSTTEISTPTTAETVAFDLYRDIHKAVRSELFTVTVDAGRTDPADSEARRTLAGRVRSLVELLDDHAAHEDDHIGPDLAVHLPSLGDRIAVDHAHFEARCAAMVDLADTAVVVPAGDRRRLLHRLYGDLASFTGLYLAHQDLEERVLMPALQRAIGVPDVIGIHQSIIGSFTPVEMAESLSIMLPVMNLDDRADLLGGVRATAPAEVFEGVWGLALSVTPAADHAPLAARLGL